MKIKLISILTIILFTLTSCAQTPIQSSTIAMNTVCTQTVYADTEIVTGAEGLLFDIEQKFSRYIMASEISRINENAGEFVSVSRETFDVIERGVDIARSTNGAFDPTIGGVTHLWDFSGEPSVPTEQELKEELSHVSYESVEFDEPSLSVKIAPEQSLDPGGIIKGYAGDVLLSYYKEENINSGLINLGGNMTAFGDKQGEPYVVGIRDPLEDAASYFCTVELRDTSLVTSGAYERFFEEEGVTYHHIIDPSTGYPADSDILSVSVLSTDGILADALSTAIFVLGSEQGLKLANDMGVEALLMLEDQTILSTDDFKTLTNFKLANR